MEKYTRWRDKGTGIAPFLPPTVSNLGFGTLLFQTAVFSLKVILLLPLFVTYGISHSKAILSWILSFLFSWKTDIIVQGVKRRDSDRSRHYPQKGKLYLCNSTSPLDAFVLEMMAQGPSCFLVPQDNVVYKMDKSQYFSFALDGSLNAKRFGREVGSIKQLKSTVNFMFAEGTCSNGKSVLPFALDNAHLLDFLQLPETDRSATLQTIRLKINGSLVTPLKVNRFKYYSTMYTRGVHFKIKINEAQKLIPLEGLRASLNDDNRFKLVSKTLNVESKRKFVQEYSSRSSYRR
ncbi:LOA1 (YPR139C) [Zygosaccharomyces parabailii]|nr:LOA1 (YPR139C) [Zygosaccharomyces parabailii]CDH08986.1 related to Lysophosphatidic acid:oleoyl-CoA acyltransferase 1 [Zygosaccharomyces bailii ISA1307]